MKPLKHLRAAREWVERAANDLEYARAGEKETSRHHITCFLCHQAVEKMLKGLLTAVGIIPEKTHALRVLRAKIAETFSDIPLTESQARRLDAFYIPSRYPGPVLQSFLPKDAQEAISIAEEVLSKTHALLK